ncbi:MAG: hypothetical protein CL579_15435 [Alteromonadaceae bacterium]|jgi:hypothetical protein|nr:hypothetical protein [Alteromonadaceae bacterium]MBB20008.1 hypothetical protein [Rickettsiales bacterium]
MNRSLIVLGVLTVLACGAGYWLLHHNLSSQDAADAALPSLIENAASVDRITLTNATGVLLNARREGDRWQTEVYADNGVQVGMFPVDREKLATLVNALSQAELIEPKTSKASNYHHLGLQDISADDSLATLVALGGNGKSWQVLVGNQSSVGNKSYMRIPKQSQAWLSDRAISLPMTNSEWLQQPILPFDETDLSSISRVDGDTWQIVRAGSDDSFVLTGRGQNQALKYAGVLDAVALNLAGLHFEQLLPQTTLQWETLTPMLTLDVNTAYGHAFQVEVAQTQENAFLRIANATPTDYWADWIYQIPKFNAEQLNKSLDDFLLEQAQEEAQEPIRSYPIDEGESPK